MVAPLRKCRRCQKPFRKLQQGLCGVCYVAGRRDGSVQLVELSGSAEAREKRLEKYRQLTRDGGRSSIAAAREMDISKRTAARYEAALRERENDGEASSRGVPEPAEDGGQAVPAGVV